MSKKHEIYNSVSSFAIAIDLGDEGARYLYKQLLASESVDEFCTRICEGAGIPGSLLSCRDAEKLKESAMIYYATAILLADLAVQYEEED